MTTFAPISLKSSLILRWVDASVFCSGKSSQKGTTPSFGTSCCGSKAEGVPTSPKSTLVSILGVRASSLAEVLWELILLLYWSVFQMNQPPARRFNMNNLQANIII
jgi:hypothetical protein